MNKLNFIIKTKKVEIWKLLKEIRSFLKCIIFVFFWMATIVTIIFCWGLVNNVNILIDFIAVEPLYLEVMGNMILLPIKVCFIFCIINIFTKISMRLVASKMNENEIAKAGMKSSIIKVEPCKAYFEKNKDSENEHY